MINQRGRLRSTQAVKQQIWDSHLCSFYSTSCLPVLYSLYLPIIGPRELMHASLDPSEFNTVTLGIAVLNQGAQPAPLNLVPPAPESDPSPQVTRV